ncbi:MAG: hypothetical protein P8X96_07440 [Desulfobacteraceae bacterium]
MKSSRVKPGAVLSAILFLLLTVACGGGSGGGGSSSGAYAAAFDEQIANFKATYGKSDAWEEWMIANKSRYLDTFAASSAKPSTITISFRYDAAPIAYSPAWIDEGEHMDALATMAEGAYAGYFFNLIFEGNTATSYANIIAGIPTNASYASGKNVYVYYETIFNHEFGHVMKLLHHYDSVGDIGKGLHMPPGDTQCIMDRTSNTFCSACSTALGIPLGPLDTTDMDNATTDMDNAAADILSRYPY